LETIGKEIWAVKEVLSFYMDAISTQLDAKRIYTTAKLVADRVEVFAKDTGRGDGLKTLAKDVIDLADSAREPKARLGLETLDQFCPRFLIAFAAPVLVFVILCRLLPPIAWSPVEPASLLDSFQMTEPILGTFFFLGTIAILAWGFIGLLRRNAALNKLHKLRSVAHVIHSHQLKKSIRVEGQPATEDSLTLDLLNRYVACCSDLLAVVAKLAALKAQDVNDPVVLDASDRIERLAHDLSEDMWRKITSAERSDFAPVGD
jgi:hypothetical protein